MRARVLGILLAFIGLAARAQDTTPPAEISDLYASSGPAGGELELWWTAAGDDGGAGAIAGGRYRIDYSSDPLHVFSPASFVLDFATSTAPGDRERLLIGGLLQNATYFARVLTADEVPNYSGLSNGATAVSGITAPLAGSLGIASVSESQLTLALVQPPNPAAGQTGSEFDNTEGAGGTDSGNLTGVYGFIDSGLSANTRYGYRARYYNAAGAPSAYGPIGYRYTRAAIPASAAYEPAGAATLRPAWSPNGNPPGTEYEVELTTDAFATLVASSLTANAYAEFAGLSAHLLYSARVRAYNAESIATSYATLADTVPFAGAPLSPSHSGNTISSISWTWSADPANPPGTEHRALDATADSGWVADGTSFPAGGKSANTLYALQVRARNAAGAETAAVSTAAYTSIETPSAVTFDAVHATSVTARALGPFTGIADGASGAQLQNQSLAQDSDWTQSLAWTFIGLSSNTSYTFRARARNGDGDPTGYSGSQFAVTRIEPPDAGAASLTPDSSTQLTLSLVPPPNPATAASGSEFDHLSGPGGSDSGKLTGAYGFVQPGLQPNTPYAYRMQYYNSLNVPSGFGPALTIRTRAASPLPLAYSAPGGEELQGNWDPNNNPAGTVYVAELSTDGFTTVAAASQTANTFARFSALPPNQTISGRVKALNGDGLETGFASLGSTSAFAAPPQSPGHSANSESAITWTWAGGAGNAPGTEYRALDASADSGWVADATSFAAGGKTANTPYSVSVRARNGSAIETAAVSTTAYTAVEAPTFVTFDMVGASSVTARIQGSFTNLSAGLSGLLARNATLGSDSGWIRASTWTSVSLSSNTSYTFRARARNGDGDETAETFPIFKITRLLAPAPGQLVLTPDSSTQLTLTLTTPPNPDLGQTGSEFDQLSGPGAADSGKLTGAYAFVQSALTPNSPYVYRTRYYNADNLATDFGDAVTRYTRAAQPAALDFSDVNQHRLTANWDPNNNPAGTVYVAEISTDAFASLVAASATANAFAQFTGLSLNTTHAARVKAVNGDGLQTGYTALGSTRTLLLTPQNPGHSGNTAAQITWTWTLAPDQPPGAEHFASDETDASGWVAGMTSWTGGGKLPNTLYTLTVKARDALLEETPAASTQAYSSIETPSGVAFDAVHATSVTARALGPFTNLTLGLSGVRLDNESAGTDSGWLQQTGADFTGLSSNTLYGFRARARNADGDQTAQSALVSTYTVLLPPAAGQLALTADSPTQLTATLAAPPNPAAGQSGAELDHLSGPGGADAGPTAGVYAFAQPGLSANMRYEYRARYRNASGALTAFGPSAAAYTRALPPGAGPLSGVVEDALTAGWTDGGNPAGTEYRAEASTNAFATVSVASVTRNAFALLPGLTPNTTYALRVQALNGDGLGTAFTALGSTRTPARAPAGAGHSFQTTASIAWSWLAGAGNPPGTQYRAVDDTADSGWVADATAFAPGAKSANTRYTLSVRARDADGRETAAASTSAYTAIEAPGGVAFDLVSDSSVTARASGSFSNLEGGLSGLFLANETAGADSGWLKANGWTSIGLASNTLYGFRARARNGDGDEAAATPLVSTYTLLRAPADAELALTPDSSTQLLLALPAPPNPAEGQSGSEFELVFGPGGAGSGALTGAYAFLATGLSPNTAYGYRARYRNGSGIPTAFTATRSTHTRAATPGALAFGGVAPQQLTANWSANNNPPGTGYEVELTTDGFGTISTASATANAFASFTGLRPNTRYEARVRARNAAGLPTAYAALGSTRTPALPPLSPGHAGNLPDTLYWIWQTPPLNPPGTEYRAFDEDNDSGWVADAAAWTSAGLQPNIQRTLRVRARDADGNETAEVSTTAYSSAQTPAGISFDDVGTSSIAVRAAGSFPRLGEALSALRFFNQTGGGDSGWISANAWTQLGLSSNAPQTVRADARNGDGDESGPGATGSRYSLLGAPAPAAIQLVADAPGQLTITVSTPPNAFSGLTGIEIDHELGPGGTDSGVLVGVYTYVDGGLFINRQYGYRVRYFNGDGVPGPYSPTVYAYSLAVQPSPGPISEVGTTALRGSWGSGFNLPDTVYRLETSSDSFATITASSATPGFTALITGLAGNTTYAVRITALNGDGVPGPYAILGSTATAPLPAAAAGFSSVGGQALVVGWSANGNGPFGKYDVQLATDAAFGTLSGSSITAQLEYRFDALTPITTYYARVRTLGHDGSLTAFISAGSTRTLADIGPPGAITDLAAATGAVEGELSLSWTAPVDDLGAAARYLLRLSLAPILSQADFDAAASYPQDWAPRAGGEREERALTGLTPGATYFVSLVSEDAALNRSPLSNPTSAWAQVDVTPPSAVADLAVIALSSWSATLRWTAPGDDGAAGTAAAYELRLSPLGALDALAKFAAAAAAAAPAPAAAGTQQTALVTGLAEGTTYHFALRARDERANRSGLSNGISAWTLNVSSPAAPAWSATPAAAGDGRISLDWLDNAEHDLAGYALERATAAGGPFVFLSSRPVSPSAYEDAGLALDATHHYRLRAFDAGGLVSVYSATVSTFLPDLRSPLAPTGLQTFSLDDGRYRLAWSPVLYNEDGSALTDLGEYRVYRGTGPSGPWSFEAAISSAGALVWTEAAPGVNRYFVVRAADGAGHESASSPAAAPDLGLHLVAADGAAALRVPRALTPALLASGNEHGQDIRLALSRAPQEEGGKVLLAYDATPRLAQTLGPAAAPFTFPKARVELVFKVPGLGPNPQSLSGTSVASGDVAAFRHDGTGWIKLGGEVDRLAGTLSVQTSRLGRFQVRESLRAENFSILQIVPNKIFTPNGDGVNDAIEFFFENPADAVAAEARIYDLSGAQVSNMKPGTTGTSFTWDGRDSGGSAVPGGIYLYQFQVEGRTLNGTVVVAR